VTSLMKQYSVLIVAARKADRKKLKPEQPDYVYLENHHIWPVAFGRDDRKQNLVLLTFPEHVEAHVLLAKLYLKAHKIQNVACRMLTDRKGEVASVEVAAEARELARDNNPAKKPENRLATSKRNNKLYAEGLHPFNNQGEANPSKKPENRAKRVLAWSGDNNPSKKLEHRKTGSLRGKRLHAEGKLTLADQGSSHPMQKPENKKAAGKRMTLRNLGDGNPQKKQKNRKASSERAKKQVQCPHCGLIGSGGIIRWHFNNCLQHPDNLGLTRQQIKARRQT